MTRYEIFKAILGSPAWGFGLWIDGRLAQWAAEVAPDFRFDEWIKDYRKLAVILRLEQGEGGFDRWLLRYALRAEGLTLEKREALSAALAALSGE